MIGKSMDGIILFEVEKVILYVQKKRNEELRCRVPIIPDRVKVKLPLVIL